MTYERPSFWRGLSLALRKWAPLLSVIVALPVSLAALWQSHDVERTLKAQTDVANAGYRSADASERTASMADRQLKAAERAADAAERSADAVVRSADASIRLMRLQEKVLSRR